MMMWVGYLEAFTLDKKDEIIENIKELVEEGTKPDHVVIGITANDISRKRDAEDILGDLKDLDSGIQEVLNIKSWRKNGGLVIGKID